MFRAEVDRRKKVRLIDKYREDLTFVDPVTWNFLVIILLQIISFEHDKFDQVLVHNEHDCAGDQREHFLAAGERPHNTFQLALGLCKCQ